MGIVTRATRNISRRKVRALLVIIALGFCMAIMVSIPAGITANQEATTNQISNLSNTITETENTISETLTQIDLSLGTDFEGFGFTDFPRNIDPSQFQDRPTPDFFARGFGGGAFGGGSLTPINETLYSDIETISGVAMVVPILTVSEGEDEVFTAPNGMEFERLAITHVMEGIPLDSTIIDSYSVLPATIIDGRNLQGGESGVVLLSENNTELFVKTVGETVILEHEGTEQSFEVVGVHGSDNVESYRTLYMNLSDLQVLTGNEGYITSISVFVENSDVVSQVSSEISELHPELIVSTSQDRLEQLELLQDTYAIQLETAEASLAQTEAMAFQEIAIALVATSLIVMFVMLYTVRERTKEIGTLKAIGFSNQNILSQFMLEGIVLSLVAGVVGIAISVFAAPILAGVLLPAVNAGFGGNFARAATATTAVGATITPEIILVVLGASVLLGAIGTFYPAWRASRTSPMEALRYE